MAGRELHLLGDSKVDRPLRTGRAHRRRAEQAGVPAAGFGADRRLQGIDPRLVGRREVIAGRGGGFRGHAFSPAASSNAKPLS
jgi:hypothetical protein